MDRTAEKIDRVRKENEVQQQKAATSWPSPLDHTRKRRDRPIRSEWRDKIPRTFSPHAETGTNLRLLPFPQGTPLVAPGNQLPLQQMDEVRIPSLFDAPSYSLSQQPPPSALAMGMPMAAAQPTPNMASLLPSSLQQLASLLPHPSALAPQPMQFPVQQPTPQAQESTTGDAHKSLDVDDRGPLPKNWKVAFDTTGNAYYYHVLTRKSQWERPTAIEEIEDNPIEMVEMDMVTPSPITPNNVSQFYSLTIVHYKFNALFALLLFHCRKPRTLLLRPPAPWECLGPLKGARPLQKRRSPHSLSRAQLGSHPPKSFSETRYVCVSGVSTLTR